ncbi:nuclease-related domain-containing protein [Actinoplanes sp. L3-i22]|uniref:nuclease-related domain-containing protein n=1 Tax=Actinoplanes sp. L3-i22 TaxID=2836373 RepID=UPI001C760112|nr:nuclease-related domain-containing protein [Actinoplanes sp. L3-i22]BCY08902.1 hypothetical protein L3i22_039900 [Actinoplanes sp. L3-i22]
MQIHVLSDHGGEQLHRLVRRLRSAETTVAAAREEYYDAYQDLQQLRRTKSWWRRALHLNSGAEQQAAARIQFASQGVTDAELDRQQITDRARQQAAGVLGEQALVDGLATLDDSWTMLRGYHNRRGETDHVLIGPAGIWAIEVKRRRVRLHVAGEQWWYEKLDARGHTVGSGWAVDATGRTWGRQVLDVAADLTSWLSRNGYQVPVRTAVMLMHDQATIGRCDNPTVNVIGTRPAHLLWAIERSGTVLSPAECRDLLHLTIRDHRLQAQRHNSQPRPA